MNHDEDCILKYLAKFPQAYVSPMEVCKRADSRKRFNENPDWAKPLLARMAMSRVLEVNVVGQYRIRVVEDEEEEEGSTQREYSGMTAEDALAATKVDAEKDAQANSPSSAPAAPAAGEQKKAA